MEVVTATSKEQPGVPNDDVGSTTEESIKADNELIEQAAHDARVKYERARGLYDDFARSIANVIQRCVEAENLVVHSITFRAKDVESFERKAARVSPDDPLSPRYRDPFDEITDKAGVRIITYFPSNVQSVAKIISSQFDIIEAIERAPVQPDRFGYQSLHYIAGYTSDRTDLPEYEKFSGLVAEIQVRTILQHAWAEIEHDIQYKATEVLPSSIRRRFAALAGLIEIADREFQAIEDADRELRKEAKRRVRTGELDEVEITTDSLRIYLDRTYGSDRRMAHWSYYWPTRVLLQLGFTNLAEVDKCVKGYDDGKISRIIRNSRMGQITRFEDVLLASMGEYFILPHPSALEGRGTSFISSQLEALDKLRANGILVGDYRPPGYPPTKIRVSDLKRLVEDAERRFQERMRQRQERKQEEEEKEED